MQQIIPSIEEGFQISTCFDDEDPDLIQLSGAQTNGTSYKMNDDILRDQQRILPFINAINRNKHLFKDKVILEINCGLGLLSILAAKAGAKEVYSVDPSEIMVFTRQVIQQNQLEGIITLINKKIEDCTDQDIPEVDIIICQWMGYFLLFEDTVESVIYARKNFLTKNGLIFPDRGILFVAAIEDEEYRDKKLMFWEKVYGVSMSCMHKWVMSEPAIENLSSKQIVSDSCSVFELDLYRVEKEDLEFSSSYKLPINRNDFVHGLIGWFEVYFTECHIPIRLSTAPFSKSVWWKQTLFYIKDTIVVHKNDILKGSIALKKKQKSTDILISFHVSNKSGKWDIVEFYKMN